MTEQGRQIFRFDTFGSELFWGQRLKLHQAIAGAAFGGVGPGLSPAAALAVGLKVDIDMLTPALYQALADIAGCARCHVPPLFTEPGWQIRLSETDKLNLIEYLKSL